MVGGDQELAHTTDVLIRFVTGRWKWHVGTNSGYYWY